MYLYSQYSEETGFYAKTQREVPHRDIGPSEWVHFRRALMRKVVLHARSKGDVKNGITVTEAKALAGEIRAAIANEFPGGYQPGDELSVHFLHNRLVSFFQPCTSSYI